MSRYLSPVLYVLLMIVGCVAFISIGGVRIGVLEPLTGFSLLRKSVIASLVLSVLAALSLGLCRNERNVGSKRFYGLVLIVSFTYSLMWIVFYIQKSDLPLINDITTDTEMPPAYLNVPYLRNSSENSTVYNKDWAAIQQKSYPNVKPIYSDQSKLNVYFEIMGLVERLGWDIVAQYPNAGVIEATARTPIFGFRDDVVIRLTQEDQIVRVDMRSCSRVGLGDYGENARRIESFMSDLSKALNRPSLALRTTDR